LYTRVDEIPVTPERRFAMRLLKAFAGQFGLGFLMGAASPSGILFYFGWESIGLLVAWHALASWSTDIFGLTGLGALGAGLLLLSAAYGLLRGAYFTAEELRYGKL
jgi:hypothetical protein